MLLDQDLADLYGVATKALVQAVKRNRRRFPPDFSFQLRADEFDDLRSQSVTSSSWGGRRYPPYAFTEQGVAMLSAVLRSETAVDVSVAIIRTFVRLRKLLATHVDLARKRGELEKRCDARFQLVFDALETLTETPPQEKGRIGFDRASSLTPTSS